MAVHQSKLEPLNYDDILLLPNYSEVKSRDDVNLFAQDKEYINIFSSPMKNISEVPFIIALDDLNAIGTLHRFFQYNKDRYEAIDQLDFACKNYGISIGINDWQDEIEIVKYAVSKKCRFVTLDTASGGHSVTIDALIRLDNFRKDNNFDFKIIAGNVVDKFSCIDLAARGADIIRVNIGSGLQCLTSKSIGIGCPTLTAIADCSNIKYDYPNVVLLADGGIYNPGQALKALAFGASGVMIGSLFGRAKECENNGLIFGMSSFMLQDRMNKTKKSNEGTVTIISKEEIRPLREIFNEFTYGLKSGLSYLGCNNINNIHDIDIKYIKSKP
jgi:IMP dehydrogenase